MGYSRELRDGRFRYLYLSPEDLNKNCMKDYRKHNDKEESSK